MSDSRGEEKKDCRPRLLRIVSSPFPVMIAAVAPSDEAPMPWWKSDSDDMIKLFGVWRTERDYGILVRLTEYHEH